MMIFVNAFIPQRGTETIPTSAMRTFLILLNPFAPHISSELWEKLKSPGDITAQAWPSYDAKFLVENEVEMVVTLDGKRRASITEPINAPADQVKRDAIVKVLGVEATAQIGNINVVIVPNKLVNIVTKTKKPPK
jgi:leucyl-tRNA synthetase